MKCSCGSDDVKTIGRFDVDCGCAGEYRWIRRRCLSCGKITMEKVRLDVEVGEEDTGAEQEPAVGQEEGGTSQANPPSSSYSKPHKKSINKKTKR